MRHRRLPFSLSLALAAAIAGLGGCANTNSIYRPLDLGSAHGGQAVAIDIKQRAIFSAPRRAQLSDGTVTEAVVVCAEPSPDALAVYAASAGASASRTGAAAQGAFGTSEAAGSVGLRTQSIQLLRDGLFSNCISYLGGALKPNEYYQLQRRSQNFTLGLLAIEQLTGVVKADAVAVQAAGATATGGDDTTKEQAALDDALDAQNEDQTALEKSQLALRNAQAAWDTQNKKAASARTALSRVPRDAPEADRQAARDAVQTEEAAAATARQDVEAARIDTDSLARDVTNAGRRVAAAQSALMLAQGRVRTATASSASLSRSGGTAGIVTDQVATAVVAIVNAVLAESGRGEQCIALWTQLTDPNGRLAKTDRDNQAQAVAQACTTAEAALAEKAFTAASGGGDTDDVRRIKEVVRDADVIRQNTYNKAPLPAPATR